MWPYIFFFLNILRSVDGHPGTVSFSGAGMEICIKQRDLFIFSIYYQVSFYIRMIFIYIKNFFKAKVVELICNSKDSINYVFKFEIWFQLFIIKIKDFLF